MTGEMEGGLDEIWDDGNMIGEPDYPEWSEWSRCNAECKRRRSRDGKHEEEYCDIGEDDCVGKA